MLFSGFFQVRKIKGKKRKHMLTCQVMKKLVSSAKCWEYVDSGSKPNTVDTVAQDHHIDIENPPVVTPKDDKNSSTQPPLVSRDLG